MGKIINCWWLINSKLSHGPADWWNADVERFDRKWTCWQVWLDRSGVSGCRWIHAKLLAVNNLLNCLFIIKIRHILIFMLNWRLMLRCETGEVPRAKCETWRHQPSVCSDRSSSLLSVINNCRSIDYLSVVNLLSLNRPTATCRQLWRVFACSLVSQPPRYALLLHKDVETFQRQIITLPVTNY